MRGGARRIAQVAVVATWCMACAWNGPTEGPEKARTTLRVALYPQVPAPETVVERLKKEFECANPDISLVLRPFSDGGDLYDYRKVVSMLTGSSGTQWDVVEIENSLLGDLAAKGVGLVAPWSEGEPDEFHPAAITAVTVEGQRFGVPHWLCSYFLFSRHPEVTAARSAEALASALENLETPIPNLAGNATGSYTMAAVYMDAWCDTGVQAKIEDVFDVEPVPRVVAGLAAVLKQSQRNGRYTSLDGTFKDGQSSAAGEFGSGQWDAMFGYSERLHAIRKVDNEHTIDFVSMPFGHGSHPLVFVDALVIRWDAGDDVRAAAAKFARYLNSPATLEWMVMAKDAGPGVPPRYLLPARTEGLKGTSIATNPEMSEFLGEISGAVPIPSCGFLEKRRVVEGRVRRALEALGLK